MIRLFYNYYEDKNPVRKKEIDYCFQRNLENRLLTTVVIESPSKLTYDFLFEQINKITGPNDINIICNSDIFFDETIALANSIRSNQVYALSRWDWFGDNRSVFFDRPDSQDTWITKGKVQNVFGGFTLGRLGCDNRIAHEFEKSGYKISNPSKSIKTHHVHGSMIRTYSRNDPVPGPYLTVPTSVL